MWDLVKFHILGLSLPSKAALLVVERFWSSACFATRKEKHTRKCSWAASYEHNSLSVVSVKSKIRFTSYMSFVGRGVSRAQHRAWPIRSSWWMFHELNWYRSFEVQKFTFGHLVPTAICLNFRSCLLHSSFPSQPHTQKSPPSWLPCLWNLLGISCLWVCKIVSF